MAIDWIAVVVFLIAWAVSQVPSLSASLKYWVYAIACFVVVGWRLRSGYAGAGLNLVLLLVVAGLGVWYAMQAVKAKR